jgi:hypothetical protein
MEKVEVMCDCALMGVPNRISVEGEQLVVEDIPECLHPAVAVGEIELLTFTRIQAPGAYRDVVGFKNGRAVRLQELREGKRMGVMNLFPWAEASEPVLAAVSRV